MRKFESSTLVNILVRNHIPLLTWATAADAEPTYCDYDLAKKQDYVAVSHVWVDRLGCHENNSITTCQLKRLMRATSAVFEQINVEDKTPERSPKLWADTLCIPNEPENQEWRNFSIQNMRTIYGQASAVLVLDPDVWCLPSTARPEEIAFRLQVSAYNSRLWTFQEFVLCPRIFALGKDCVHDLRRIRSDISWSFLRGGFLGWKRWIDRTMPYKDFDTDAAGMLLEMSERVTSRSDDELVCIGTALGFDTLEIIRARPEDRMTVFLKKLPSIPSNVLFSLGTRCTTPGFRWAPRSFLNAFGGTVEHPFRRVLVDIDGKEIPRPISSLDRAGRGIWSFLPAVALTSIAISESSNLSMVSFSIAGKLWTIAVKHKDPVRANKAMMHEHELNLRRQILSSDVSKYAWTQAGLIGPIQRSESSLIPGKRPQLLVLSPGEEHGIVRILVKAWDMQEPAGRHRGRFCEFVDVVTIDDFSELVGVPIERTDVPKLSADNIKTLEAEELSARWWLID